MTDIDKSSESNDLDRFIRAQEQVYGHVLTELQNGRKRTHWMWFIFPQLDGRRDGRTLDLLQYPGSEQSKIRT